MTQNDNQKLVDAKGLIDGLCHKSCKPSIRTIRRLTADRKIPFVRFGGRVLFDINHVRAALAKQPTSQVGK